jgi:hypothetical protein
MNDTFTWPVGREHNASARDGRRSRLPPAAAYVAGTVIGGSAAGLLLGLIGSGAADIRLRPLHEALMIALLALAVMASGLELLGRVEPLPESRAQVPKRWLFWRRRWKTGLAFGLMLGAGVFTHMQHAALYVLAVVIVLAGSPWVGVVVGGTYGLGRGTALVVTWTTDRIMGKRLRWERLYGLRPWTSTALVLCGAASVAATIVVAAPTM